MSGKSKGGPFAPIGLATLLLFAAPEAICAQALESPHTFTVVSVKRVRAQPNSYRRDASPGGIRYHGVGLMELMQQAYEVDLAFIIDGGKLGGGNALYDIDASLPNGASMRQIPEMLRQLLAERFHLIAHRETRRASVYALTADKGGLKLKASQDSATERDVDHPRTVNGPGRLFLEGPMTMKGFARWLCPMSRVSLGAPVVDRTGDDGEFDIVLYATTPLPLGSPAESEFGAVDGGAISDLLSGLGGPRLPKNPPTLTSALKQMGLKMERQRLPVEYVVIDRVNLDPTEN